ncbi:MAG: chemotaxis protein CheD [Ginsengibacter sp.]
MIPNIKSEMEKHYLYPGKIFCSKESHVVDTILGSCVAVFVWDPVLHFGSVNHYMLPTGNPEKNDSFKYGKFATEELVRRMLKAGSERNDLKAKVFGGSDLGNPGGAFNIGQRNIAIAQEVLGSEKIPIISYSVGGTLGRKVTFNSGSGIVLISYIKRNISLIDQQTRSLPNTFRK